MDTQDALESLDLQDGAPSSYCIQSQLAFEEFLAGGIGRNLTAESSPAVHL